MGLLPWNFRNPRFRKMNELIRNTEVGTLCWSCDKWNDGHLNFSNLFLNGYDTYVRVGTCDTWSYNSRTIELKIMFNINCINSKQEGGGGMSEECRFQKWGRKWETIPSYPYNFNFHPPPVDRCTLRLFLRYHQLYESACTSKHRWSDWNQNSWIGGNRVPGATSHCQPFMDDGGCHSGMG